MLAHNRYSTIILEVSVHDAADDNSSPAWWWGPVSLCLEHLSHHPFPSSAITFVPVPVTEVLLETPNQVNFRCYHFLLYSIPSLLKYSCHLH